MLLNTLRAALRRILAPLVNFATVGTRCEWNVEDDDDGGMYVVIVDGFGQRYAMALSADDFRDMAAKMVEMADEHDPPRSQ